MQDKSQVRDPAPKITPLDAHTIPAQSSVTSVAPDVKARRTTQEAAATTAAIKSQEVQSAGAPIHGPGVPAGPQTKALPSGEPGSDGPHLPPAA